MRRGMLDQREKIAVSVLNGLCANMPPDLVTQIGDGTRGGKFYIETANILAAAMLRSFGVTDDRLAHAEERAKRAEEKFAALQSIHVNMQGEELASARIALTEIWEFLGVDNQTNAMGVLRLWKADVAALLMAEKTND